MSTVQRLARKKIYQCDFAIPLAEGEVHEIKAQVYPVIASTEEEALQLVWLQHTAELWSYYCTDQKFPGRREAVWDRVLQRKDEMCKHLHFTEDTEAPILKCFKGYVSPDITIELK